MTRSDDQEHASDAHLVEERSSTGVMILTMNRPGVLNALTMEMLETFSAALDSCHTDETVGAVILTGRDRAFCSGEDLRVAASNTSSEFASFIDYLQAFTQKLLTAPIPTVAAVNGPAIGGGCELALACDVRIASTDATFSMPEVGLGLFVTGGTLELLRQIIGRGRAAELLLTGRAVDAEEAHAIGLVSEVVPAGELMSTAQVLATRLAALPKEALVELKRALSDLQMPGITRAMEAETAAVNRLFAMPSVQGQLHEFVNNTRRGHD